MSEAMKRIGDELAGGRQLFYASPVLAIVVTLLMFLLLYYTIKLFFYFVLFLAFVVVASSDPGFMASGPMYIYRSSPVDAHGMELTSRITSALERRRPPYVT